MTGSAPEHRLAEYALSIGYGAMDPVVRDRVADIVLDNIGIAIGAHAARQPTGMICEDYIVERRGNQAGGGATLWSGRGAVAPDEAALANGTWAEILDFQDTVIDPRNNGHAAVTIVPAVIAVAEQEGAGGKDIIAAVAAGLEVTVAILRAVGRAHRAEGRGFRTTSIAAPVGAAVACAKLLGLTQEQTLNAMGLAAACANNGLMPSLSILNGSFGMDKDWVNGLSAQLAVNCANLAGRGMTGSHAAVTGERGIVASHGHGGGADLETPNSGTPNIQCIALKKYAACYGVHTAVEAALELLAAHKLDAADIERVTVYVKADSATTLGGRNIANHLAARFSLPYAVASAVVRGRCAIADFDEPAIADATVLAFMDRVHIEADGDLTHFHDRTGGFPARVEINAAAKRVECRIDYPAGSHQRPMSRQDVMAKFTALTRGRWPDGRQAQIVAMGSALDRVGDIRELTRLL